MAKNVFAAVMTAEGTGAISTIQLYGASAKSVIKKIFTPTGTKRQKKFQTGQIILGDIVDGDQTVDQVTIGCESAHSYTINCHGNPLIVADIMRLLENNGAKLIATEELFTKVLTDRKDINAIEAEVKLAIPKAKTLAGTKILTNQINFGLSEKARHWLDNIETISLEQLQTQAEQILVNSETAKLIIYGCKAILAGPPNSGKSTLLNCLCGNQKAIVTHIEGTTRDWVSGQCRIAELSVELIDTAGLADQLNSVIDKAAQQKAIEFLEGADLVLLVLDNSDGSEQLNEKLLEKIKNKKVLVVLNKTDLPEKFDTSKLSAGWDFVRISAKFETGIEKLRRKIPEICGVVDFDLKQPVVFTERQSRLLNRLGGAKSKTNAKTIIKELLR